MQVPVYNVKGEVVDRIELREDIFGIPFNEAVVHQTLVRQLANRRAGTADTKTRSEVRGSGRKLFRQKHTGLARRGSRRSPLLRGGGVIFGPHPRSYNQVMPKKMRRLALKCVLSAKVKEDELRVVDRLEFEQPRTRTMVAFLSALGVDSSALIATAEVEPNLVKSARNLPGIKTLSVSLLNIADLLSYEMLVLSVGAVVKIEQLWGQRRLPKVTSAA